MFVNLSALPSTGVKVRHSLSLSYFPLRWSMCSLARCLWTVEQEIQLSTRPPCEWRGTTLMFELLPPAVPSLHHLFLSPIQPTRQLLFLRLAALLADPRCHRCRLRLLHVLRDHAQL